MKALVIFGSKSDANIYEPLKARLLAEGHDVDFRMISVHRSPELLDKELLMAQAHCVIAGAGLAAHLPGILASKVLVPVFGIPCAAAIGGVDAFFAIAQMPFGIPVFATAPDQYSSAVDFVSRWHRLELQFSFERFNIVVERHKKNLPHFVALLERAAKISEKTKIDIHFTERPVENEVNVCLADINANDPECPLPYGPASSHSDELRIFVPVLNEHAYRDPYSGVSVMRRVNSIPGGLFTGINNIGNAMLAALQLANAGGVYSPFLVNAKKGYIHA